MSFSISVCHPERSEGSLRSVSIFCSGDPSVAPLPQDDKCYSQFGLLSANRDADIPVPEACQSGLQIRCASRFPVHKVNLPEELLVELADIREKLDRKSVV